jgi:propanediol dehydratase small subunit
MTLDLTPQLKANLEQAAHHCSIPPENLARLFVEDSLRSYRDSHDELDELRDSINREDQ